MKKNNLYYVGIILFVLAIILFVILGLVGYTIFNLNSNTSTDVNRPNFNNTSCNYNSPEKTYINRDKEQCKAIRFFCTEGKKPFFDYCGCGCEKIIYYPNNDNKNNNTKWEDETCLKYNPDNCPESCSVCPPCKECSSISCRSKEFCKNIGFDENWYDNIKPNNCKESDRNVEVCGEIYSPVCGWFNQDIKCIKFPCANTYTNPCNACRNPGVIYYTKGICPK